MFALTCEKLFLVVPNKKKRPPIGRRHSRSNNLSEISTPNFLICVVTGGGGGSSSRKLGNYTFSRWKEESAPPSREKKRSKLPACNFLPLSRLSSIDDDNCYSSLRNSPEKQASEPASHLFPLLFIGSPFLPSLLFFSESGGMSARFALLSFPFPLPVFSNLNSPRKGGSPLPLPPSQLHITSSAACCTTAAFPSYSLSLLSFIVMAAPSPSSLLVALWVPLKHSCCCC